MSTPTNQYRRRSDGYTQGAYAGSPLDKVLAKDGDWLLVDSAEAAKAPAETNPPEGQPTNLDDLSRDELNRLAEEKGVEDADSLPNKAAVIEAIKATETPAE